MLQYVLKRILYFIPTFLLISLVVFFLSKCAGEQLACETAIVFDIEQCKKEAHLKGYDKPMFYFSFSTVAHPDTLHRFFRAERRAALNKLIAQYGNWTQINAYYQQISQLESELESLAYGQSSNGITKIRKAIQQLFVAYKDPVIQSHLGQINVAVRDSVIANLSPLTTSLNDGYEQLKNTATPHKLLIPSIKWYGVDNQYHYWLSNFLSGNFGISFKDSRPVMDKIKEHLPWTLYINLMAIFFAYLLSVPLGVYSAVYKNSQFDKWITFCLMLLFSLPVFWAGTMLVNFFTTPEYGLKWFPSIGLPSFPEAATIWEKLWLSTPSLILPVFCLTYGALAFITRQMRSSMLEALQQDFIRTARAKGLSERTVIWKHAFKNSLFPLITIFGSVLPAAFAGSVIVEHIFNITGMGWLMLRSIQAGDWPVVYAILMITAILTMLGILIADILYAIIDPRVRFGKG